MSTSFKLAIPFLDKNLKKEYLTEKYGFIGMYNFDINHPADNKVYLMFEYNIKNKYCSERFKAMERYSYCKNRRSCRINGKWVDIYTYNVSNPIYSLLSRNSIILGDKSKLKIIDFWGTSDEDVNKFILHPLTTKLTPETKVIPEEDYVDFDEIIKTQQGLQLRGSR